MRITLDCDVCIGSGNCVRIAADIFDQDAEAIVTLVDPTPPPDRIDAVRAAVDSCPTSAIRLAAG